MILGILLLVVAFLSAVGVLRLISVGAKGITTITVTNIACIVVEVLAAIKLMR